MASGKAAPSKSRRLKGALDFVQHEASGGVMLLAAALFALFLANSPLAYLYGAVLDTPVSIRVGSLALDKNLLHWVNDGLMAIFFFHVGLEIKRELLVGELSTVKQASLPVIGAVGGMIVPAVIYVAINATRCARARRLGDPYRNRHRLRRRRARARGLAGAAGAQGVPPGARHHRRHRRNRDHRDLLHV